MAKKILLADDSITIQKVIELTFSDEDFEVVTVGNGRLAVERVQDVQPDIVLCDIIMPEKDGYEVCDFIKKNPATAHVPVLLLTGAFEPFDQERASRVGCDGYLAKPFEPQSLIAKVKDLLSQSAAKPRAAAPVVAPAPPPPAVVPPPPAVAPPPPPVAFAPPAPPPPAPPAYFTDDTEVIEPVEDMADLGGVGAEAPMSDIERETLAADEPMPLEDEPAPWSQPTVEVPLETRAKAGVEAAQQAAAASEPMFEEMFEEAEPEPEPMAAATEAPPVDEGFGFVKTGDIAGSPAMPSAPAPSVPETVREGFGWARERDLAPGAPTAVPPPPQMEFEPEPEEEPEAPVSVEDETFGFVRTQDLAGTPVTPSAPSPAVPQTVREGFGWAREADLASTLPGPSAAAPAPAAPAEPEKPVLARPASPHWPPAPDTPEAEKRAPEPLSVGGAAPESSFAEVAPAAAVAEPAPSSAAAEVGVPMEMVEKIAQRVVAQISEKVIREIAWEVIPDLAESLIRKEIERLKAESEGR